MFVSYAQNFEDVILRRALKQVENGFYIDVGAQDPVVDSVSLAFYEQGWRGVHVEPNDDYADKLRRARPDEEVFQVAISREAGTIKFYEIADTGLSTGDEEIARRHQEQDFALRQVTKPCLPLSAILDAYKEREVHWLKIDVEGMEEQVVDSWLPSDVRPWIVIVEATKPLSPETSGLLWEPTLLDIGYDFAYFDGLNRFYVSRSHQELKASFGPGPNVFDDFFLAGVASAPFCRKLTAEMAGLRGSLADAEQTKAALETRLAKAEGVNTMLDTRLVQAEAANTTLDTRLAEALTTSLALRHQLAEAQVIYSALDERLAAIYASTSWKLTKPLRFLSRTVRSFARGIWAWTTLKPGSRPRRTARAAGMRLASFVQARPSLAAMVKPAFRRLPPALAARLRHIASQSTEVITERTQLALVDTPPLSPRAKEIYAKLSGRN